MEHLNILKLGTRRSLLARAQSQWVANEIENKNPGISIELVGIDTKGDQFQNVSLQKLEGKDFFVAELDEALKNHRVDFTVHSMKDLSLERPDELINAAIPKRENPRDIVLFNGNVIESLQKGKKLKIGTSSPRRIHNIPSFLSQTLPHFSQKPSFQMIEIRGNVNTRLARIHEEENSERYLDGVVLAFAGLIRLWQDCEAQEVLKKLLRNIRFMIPPLAQNPTAPAQGALAIECRKEDQEIFKILRKIHHPLTEIQVNEERNILKEWGGGCHQQFGATMTHIPELGNLFWIKGRKMNGDEVDELRWNAPKNLNQKGMSFWNGHAERSLMESKISTLLDSTQISAEALFVAHSRALPHEDFNFWNQKRIWTSGISSWYRLAQKGIWVEGCAEGFGFENWKHLFEGADSFSKNIQLLSLPPLKDWAVLTHSAAMSDWENMGMTVIPTYHLEKCDNSLEIKNDQASRERLKKAQFIYWSSGSQVQKFKNDIPKDAIHACGPGKTFYVLQKLKIAAHAFPSVEHWKEWIKK